MSLKKLVGKCISRPHEPISDDEASRVSQRLGFDVPFDLRRLYSLVGAGTFRRRFFANDKYEFEINALIPASSESPRNVATVYDDVVRRRRLIPPGLLPFATGSGGDFYCVDLKDSSILFVPMDPPGSSPRLVATTLEDFLGGLEEALDF